MSVNTYTPDSTKIIHNTSVDFVTRYINAPVHLVQFDNSSPVVAVKLYSNGTPYVIPEGMDVNIRVKKPDGTAIYNPALGCNVDRTEIYFEATSQMCAVDGELYPIIEITDLTAVAASGYILVQVDKNPVTYDKIKSTSEAKSLQAFADISKSWAVGDTGVRDDEDTDNSKYYAEQSALREAQASVYANDAARSAINAEDSANKAKESEDNAKTSEEAAAQAVLDAQAEVRKAEGEVVKAKAEVENAQAEVVKAKEEVEKAKGYANNAEASSVIAANAADSAQTDAINAANSATVAQMYAENAEAIVGIGIATTDKAGILKPDGTSSWVDPDGTLHTAAGEADMNTKDYVNPGGTGIVLKSRKVGEADTKILEGFSEDPETGHLLYNDKPIASESDGLYTNKKEQYKEDASKVSDGTAVIITDDMDDEDEDMSTDYVNPDHFEFQNGVMSLSEKVSAKISKLDDGGEIDQKVKKADKIAVNVSEDANTATGITQLVNGWGYYNNFPQETFAQWGTLVQTWRYPDHIGDITKVRLQTFTLEDGNVFSRFYRDDGTWSEWKSITKEITPQNEINFVPSCPTEAYDCRYLKMGHLVFVNLDILLNSDLLNHDAVICNLPKPVMDSKIVFHDIVHQITGRLILHKNSGDLKTYYVETGNIPNGSRIICSFTYMSI